MLFIEILINNAVNFKQFYAEARLQHNEQTQGIDEFIAQLDAAFAGNEQLFADLKRLIVHTKCPSISFEPLKMAMGISKTDACIINSNMLRSNLDKCMYVVLHEVAHQRQYTSRGEDIAHDIYLGTMNEHEAAQKLLSIENTADRWARRMMHALYTKHQMQMPHVPLHYKNASIKSIEMQINAFRSKIRQMNITSIEQANEMIYNLIK